MLLTAACYMNATPNYALLPRMPVLCSSAVVELCLLRLTNARKLTDLPLDALDNIRQVGDSID